MGGGGGPWDGCGAHGAVGQSRGAGGQSQHSSTALLSPVSSWVRCGASTRVRSPQTPTFGGHDSLQLPHSPRTPPPPSNVVPSEQKKAASLAAVSSHSPRDGSTRRRKEMMREERGQPWAGSHCPQLGGRGEPSPPSTNAHAFGILEVAALCLDRSAPRVHQSLWWLRPSPPPPHAHPCPPRTMAAHGAPTAALLLLCALCSAADAPPPPSGCCKR